MVAHWTYEHPDFSAGLEQGDILAPTEKLRAIFGSVHPHFNQDKYLGFLVATQSCDLVVRGNTPKASYINLAAIRPLSQVIAKISAEVAEPAAEGTFRKSSRAEVRRLLERLFNQNEQAIGLFFLYPDAEAGIGEEAIAFLRVTIALKASHYDILRQARVGRLSPDFRAKLGWLIGNLYGRPAARDWTDQPGGQKTLDNLILRYMTEVRWVEDEIVFNAKQAGIDILTASPETLEGLRPTPLLERALDVIKAEMGEVDDQFDAGKLKKLQNRLRNSGKFRKLFR